MISPSPAFDLAADLALLTEAALAAGEVMRKRHRGPYQVWSKGAAGPVTEVDLEVDALLKAHLLAARPAYGWLSEESEDDHARLDCERVFVVDPIDGTRGFIKGDEDFCTAIAVVENGRPVAGVVYHPIAEQMFTAGAGLGARLNDAPIRVSEVADIAGMRLSGAPSAFASDKWAAPWPDMEVEKRSPMALRGAFVASGKYDAMMSFGFKHEWDVAPPAAIAAEAGAVISDPWGAPLVFNSPHHRVPGVVMAGPALHPLLVARVKVLPHPSD